MKTVEADLLEELVQSLTPSEKRYVKLFILRHQGDKDSQLVKLFELMGKATSSDEQLMARLKGAVTKSQLSSARHNLYRTILKSMRLFHEEHSVRKQLRDRMDNAEFLFDRRLYRQTMRELEKAKSMAGRYEFWPMLAELLRFEQDVLVERNSRNVAAELDTLHEQVLKLHEQLVLENLSNHLRRKCTLLSRNKNIMQREEFSATYEPLSLEAEELSMKTAGFRVHHNYLFIRATGFYSAGDFPEAMNYFGKLLFLWEEQPSRIEEDSIVYKKMVSNYMMACHAANRLDLLPDLFGRLVHVPCRSAEEEAEQFQNLAFLKLLYLMNTDGFGQLDELVVEIEAGLRRFKTKINKAREIAFYHNLATAYFLAGNWKCSLEWLNRLVHIDKTDHRQDVQAFARLFRLLLYFELRKHDLLEYEMINVERYLRLHKAWTAHEAMMVRHLKKMLDDGEGEYAGHLRQFLNQLEQPQTGKTKSLLPGAMEVQLWIRHRLENRSMRELLQEENRERAKAG